MEPTLSTDLGAERDVEKIAVEINSFLGVSQIVDLQKAIGQYVIYRALLREREPKRAIIQANHTEELLDDELIAMGIPKNKIRLGFLPAYA